MMYWYLGIPPLHETGKLPLHDKLHRQAKRLQREGLEEGHEQGQRIKRHGTDGTETCPLPTLQPLLDQPYSMIKLWLWNTGLEPNLFHLAERNGA